MPAAFSGERPARRRLLLLLLLLLLLCLGLSGGSPADPTITTQDASQSQANSLTKMQAGLNESSPEPMTTTRTVNWQTQGSSSNHLTLGLNMSTPALLGPDLSTQEFKQATKENVSNITFVEYEVLLPGVSGTSVEKNVTLDSATQVELSCRLDKKYSHLKSLQVTWKRGNETIGHIHKTENSWSIQLRILDDSKLGSYSCTLKGEEEISAMFHLQVPKIEGKEKPIVSYEGDTAVMICKSSGYTPIAWTWYMTNGSEQIAINDSLLADKYVINRISANVTHLKILKLTKEDDGVYWCEAAFELGKSKGKLKLRVLSLMVPLKPFLAIVAEVVILVTIVFLYEMYSKKKEKCAHGKEFDQVEQLKSEESNGLENSSARHRKI
ncbi:embigin isoform X1 [Pelecanus crispus]|uniref:embigin isoform X1 n=1 Tax=Pelecanus crispus TaxID=36300 RepID=UPI003F5D1359